MSRRSDRNTADAFFHVTNPRASHAPLFERASDYRAFLAALESGLQRYPVRLVAYCLLANHFYLVTGPNNPAQLSRLMNWVANTHATLPRVRRKSIGLDAVSETRFEAAVLRGCDEVLRARRNVERLALHAGLVRRAQDWPWCSLADRLSPTRTLPLVTTPFLEREAWIAYVNAGWSPREMREDWAVGPSQFRGMTSPRRHAGSETPPSALSVASTFCGLTIKTMPTPMLKVRSISASLK